jgi:microcystin-dependent protein
MADPFVAEVRILPFNFAPPGWAWCDGQILPISQNTALFSLLGTTYGGDGKSNFALPNLQGSAAMHPGQGPGLSLHDLGETGGTETVTLLQSEMPVHTHTVPLAAAAGTVGTLVDPTNATWAQSGGQRGQAMYASGSGTVQMGSGALAVVGGDQPHNNMPPYLTLYFNIALQGVFPPRT